LPNSIAFRDDLVITEGDTVRQFLLLSGAHNSTMSERVGFTPVRVVCMNTLAQSHSASGSMLLRIKHTKGMKDTLDLARRLIDVVHGEFAATAEQYRQLAKLPINQRDVERYVRYVLGYDPEIRHQDLPAKSRTILENIFARYESPRGSINSDRTWWRAYNSVTEHLTFGAGRSAENRLRSSWFGPNSEKNRFALETALVMGGVQSN